MLPTGRVADLIGVDTRDGTLAEATAFVVSNGNSSVAIRGRGE